MKEINYKDTILGRKMLYEVISKTVGRYLIITTNFYSTEVKYETVRKYGFFGKKIQKPFNPILFKLPVNIESSNYSKDDIKQMIYSKLQLLQRKKEIANGNII